MQGYKTLTWSAVQRAAELLMSVNERTTTLEVKQYLRRRGYWAVQAEVSFLMRCVAESEGWSVHSNGQFREYKPASQPREITFVLFMN